MPCPRPTNNYTPIIVIDSRPTHNREGIYMYRDLEDCWHAVSKAHSQQGGDIYIYIERDLEDCWHAIALPPHAHNVIDHVTTALLFVPKALPIVLPARVQEVGKKVFPLEHECGLLQYGGPEPAKKKGPPYNRCVGDATVLSIGMQSHLLYGLMTLIPSPGMVYSMQRFCINLKMDLLSGSDTPPG